METSDDRSPNLILNIANGAWGTFALATAVQLDIFSLISISPKSSDELASSANLSSRGTLALLDALVAVQAIKCVNGRYSNTQDSNKYLVKNSPHFLGDLVGFHISPDLNNCWLKLPEAVSTGKPQMECGSIPEVPENQFWEDLIRATAPMAENVALQVAQDLEFSKVKEPKIFDIGGGSGLFSLTLLRQAQGGSATQLDWSNVNLVAQEYADELSLSEKFNTLDGDFHKIDFGIEVYDYIIYSNIAHQESPSDNMKTLNRIKKALKSNGCLIISDFILDDNRHGNKFSLLFNCNMLLNTKNGATYTEKDYRVWAIEAGFKKMDFRKTQGPSTLFYCWK